ncbi:MAG: hypothetical protein WBR29_00060 [Gammaproteobacteria bacterium]
MDNTLKDIQDKNAKTRIALGSPEQRKLYALEQIADSLEAIQAQLFMISVGLGQTRDWAHGLGQPK